MTKRNYIKTEDGKTLVGRPRFPRELKLNIMSDKRTVHTDALQTLGTIIDDSAKRDAIHLAVEPVIAGEQLSAGDHVGIVEGKATTKAEKKLGIVDPFISGAIPQGTMFWLIVYPRQISSLRHVWEHPDFPQKIADHLYTKEESKEWLKDWCDSNDSPPYEDFIEWAEDREAIDSYYFHTGSGEYTGAIPPELWDHVSNITGVPIKERPEYFSCAC